MAERPDDLEEPVTAEIVAPEAPGAPEDEDARSGRVPTAVSPVIRGDSVSIPTPAWGVAVPEEIETIEAELVETGVADAIGSGPMGDGIPEREWTPLGRRWPGWTALLVAAGTAVVTGIAVSMAAKGQSEPATTLAWVAIWASAVAFLGGIVAAVANHGRSTGALAAVVALFANPWILLQVLTLLHG